MRVNNFMNINVNAATLTKPNNLLFCFVQLSFNGYSKTAFYSKIAYVAVTRITRIRNHDHKISLAKTYGRGWG